MTGVQCAHMKRILNYLRIDWSNRKHVRVALMLVLVVAANVGVFIEQTHAQEQPTEQQAPAENSTEAAAAPEAPKTAEPADDTISFVRLFNAGGWSMWPLLACSIVGLMVIMERLYFYQVTKVTTKTFQQELLDATATDGLNGIGEVLEKNNGYSIATILKEGLTVSGQDPDLFSRGVEREAGSLMVSSERGLAILAAVSTIAPLIGFLGTVSGMIGAFDAIATADSVNAKVVAGGIKEALITTAAGLIIGIPAMAFFQYFSSRVNGWASDIAQAANSIYKELLRRQGKSTAARETTGVGAN